LAKALIVAAPQSGSGKTLFTLGLIRALRNQGYKVGSAKVGPDYIDPQFHAAASGGTCVNLDLWAMGENLCRSLLADAARGQDIVIVEGVMGLFDGPVGARGSTADLAEALDLPVVLLVDASHQAQSIGALVHGFRSYRPGVNIAGVVLNRVRSERHLAILADAVGEDLLGAVRQIDSVQLPSRHLGLVQAQEIQQLETVIEEVASAVARETIVDNLFQIGSDFSNHVQVAALPPLGSRIAVARDAAFSFCYPHILQGWRDAGAEVSFFSPLVGEAPSDVADAIYLPGGYPELHAGKISSNAAFLGALRKSTALIYGECGGYMVLGDALVHANGHSHAMAGLLPVTTSFAAPKLHLGYRQLVPINAPWNMALRGHEFHYSNVISHGSADPLFHAKDAAGKDLGNIGMRRGKVMGSYAHLIAVAP
jgi:cobyrinic acid a,c-diamide synthase